jgi:hypothetical protein
LDIADHHGIGGASLYPIVWEVLEAINATFPLDFPSDKQELQDLAAEFHRLSGGYMDGCVGAIDGIAVKIEQPRGHPCTHAILQQKR